MKAMAIARQPEPAPLASIDFISVRYLTWGRAYTAWSVERGGTGRHAEEGDERQFTVPAEAFDRILEIMRPWERESVFCSNAPTDGPYGEFRFSGGGEERSSGWRLGCDSENAADLYRRLDEADNAIHALMSTAPSQ